MSFIGIDTWPAPQLKDAELSDQKLPSVYLDIIQYMRKMYQYCRLVHADLSEFNILYHKNSVWFIDVSQGVDIDHVNSLEFLRRDCSNITNFFQKRGLMQTMSTHQLFDFITDSTITQDNLDEYLNKIGEIISTQGEITEEEKVQEEVFKHSYIPKSLKEIEDPFHESQQSRDIFHFPLTGLNSDLTPAMNPSILSKKEECEEKNL